MERIVPDLYIIELSGVNAYLWTGDAGPTLIDTGYPWTTETLFHKMQSVGVQPADLQRVIITHADIDHVGGLRAVRAASQAPVCCHAAETDYVQGEQFKRPNPSVLGYLSLPLIRLLQRRYRPEHKQIEELVIEGDVLHEGFQILHMPGHSPGQMALYHKADRLLIVGDALSNRGDNLSMPPKLFTPHYAAAIESLNKLRKLEYDIACFGHGPPLRQHASETINAFIQSLNE